MAKAKRQPDYTPRALKVYYGVYPYAYSETFSEILCDRHRDGLFSTNPTAYGSGEYFPVEECERCKAQKDKTISLAIWDAATNEQRQWWLDNGYLLSHNDGEVLSARLVREEA